MLTTLEEAIQIIARLQATIAQLEAENAALKQQIADLTVRPTTSEQAKALPAIKASTPKRPKKPRRKRDPQHNHGRKREPPTRIATHALDQCPYTSTLFAS